MADYGYITLRDKRQCLMPAGCSIPLLLNIQCQANPEIQILEIIHTHVTARACGCERWRAER